MNKETLTQLHNVELDILDEIVRICSIHNLRYYLAGGTLLGAVRHKGFIPWDDDLDIAMPRPDYDKFCSIATKELKHGYYLSSVDTEKRYWLPFAKVRKCNTLLIEATTPWLKDTGIWVDVFPLDLDRLDNMVAIQERFHKHAVYRALTVGFLRNEFFHPSWILGYIKTGFPSFKSMNRRIYSIITGGATDKSDAYVNYGSQYGVKKQTMPISWYDPAVDIEFEGRSYKAPAQYEKFLKRLYGDNYMQLPPLEKRVTHNPVRLSFDTNGPDEVLE